MSIEGDSLKAALLPFQLAVKVKAGVEVLPHIAKAWCDEWKDDDSRVLADFDQSNAHNTVDRAAFLQRVHEVILGAARWLRWIYPLAKPTYVFYNGFVIESRAGGQQGCPLIGACHALVQRAVPESLGLCPLIEGCSALLPTLDPPAELDTAALFADDGIIAGGQSEVARSIGFLKEHMPKVGLQFSKVDIQAYSRSWPNQGAAPSTREPSKPWAAT